MFLSILAGILAWFAFRRVAWGRWGFVLLACSCLSARSFAGQCNLFSPSTAGPITNGSGAGVGQISFPIYLMSDGTMWGSCKQSQGTPLGDTWNITFEILNDGTGCAEVWSSSYYETAYQTTFADDSAAGSAYSQQQFFVYNCNSVVDGDGDTLLGAAGKIKVQIQLTANEVDAMQPQSSATRPSTQPTQSFGNDLTGEAADFGHQILTTQPSDADVSSVKNLLPSLSMPTDAISSSAVRENVKQLAGWFGDDSAEMPSKMIAMISSDSQSGTIFDLVDDLISACEAAKSGYVKAFYGLQIMGDILLVITTLSCIWRLTWWSLGARQVMS